jgi:Rrf2 family protein
MKITALEEYGLRCMVLLAQTGRKQTLTIPEIGQMEKLSIPYTGKLLMLLKKAGLITAERGRHGGYFLTRTPQEITLKDIFAALGDPVFGSSHCNRYGTGDGNGGNCVHEDCCTVRTVWNSFHHLINDYLEKSTLADLIKTKPAFVRASEVERSVEEIAASHPTGGRSEYAENRTTFK